MNVRKVIDESTGPVSLSAAFNNDCTCFSVGLDTGFCVFSSDPCELKTSRGPSAALQSYFAIHSLQPDFNAGIGAAEMLGLTNYLAIVGGGRHPKFPQNKLIIWDDAKQKPAITLEFRTSVLRVRLSKARIVVALQNSVHMYKFSSPPERISVFETSDNPLGLVCLGTRLLAFPGRSAGMVQLVEMSTGNVSIIPTHSSALRAMSLSPDEEVLATASETGTLVRVFSTANCARIAELRRGVDPATIFSIAISPSNSLLAVTSDKSTLHIFDLPNDTNRVQSTIGSLGPPTPTEEGANQKWGILGKIPLLPRVFSDIYSFASAHFEIGDETPQSPSLPPVLGVSGGRPSKGVIGWSDDRTILVISAGRDGRWERFRILDGDEGKRTCSRDGWKRFLGGG